MAAAINRTFSHKMFSRPAAAKTPAVTRSESPGRKNPTISPVSAKTIAVIAESPPTATIVSTSVSWWKRCFNHCMGRGMLPKPEDGLRLGFHSDERVHGRTRERRNRSATPGPRDVAEPVRRLRDHRRDPRVQRDLSEDGASRFRAPDDPLRSRCFLPGAQVPEALHRGVPQRGHLLRERRQPHPGRLRRGVQAEEDGGEGDVLVARWDLIRGRGEVSEGAGDLTP